MGIFDLVVNTIEGVAETAVNTAKLVATPVTVIFDEDAPSDAVDGIKKGIGKIGKTDSN